VHPTLLSNSVSACLTTIEKATLMVDGGNDGGSVASAGGA